MTSTSCAGAAASISLPHRRGWHEGTAVTFEQARTLVGRPTCPPARRDDFRAYSEQRDFNGWQMWIPAASSMEIVEAQRLLDAARGDIEVAKKLRAPCRHSLGVSGRRSAARAPRAANREIVPHLARFREIGAVELKSYERRLVGRSRSPSRKHLRVTVSWSPSGRWATSATTISTS